jgi:hypothetical protein
MKTTLNENISRIKQMMGLNEQETPEMPDGDKKGTFIKSGEGGGNDPNSWDLSNKQVDSDNNSRQESQNAWNDFLLIMREIESQDKDFRLINYEENSKFSHIMVFRKPYVEAGRFDRFMILFTHKYESPDALYGKSFIKIGYTIDKGVHNLVTNTYSYPFNKNKIVNDFIHMTTHDGVDKRVDIKDVKGLKTGQYGDFVPKTHPMS